MESLSRKGTDAYDRSSSAELLGGLGNRTTSRGCSDGHQTATRVDATSLDRLNLALYKEAENPPANGGSTW